MITVISKRIFIVTVLIIAVSWVFSGSKAIDTGSGYHSAAARQESDIPGSPAVLKVMTLNVAHGRKDAFNQMFVSEKKIRQNLMEIADIISSQDADVIALQEADGPSRWSGNFDHVAFIADQADYPYYKLETHADSWLFSYGTAILSRFPISETIAHTFKPSPPTFNKGFLLARVMWKPDPGADQAVPIDIVSVHLDFSRKKVRQNQIVELAETMTKRDYPKIILGDFNSEWFSRDSVVKQLAERAQLKVYQPDAKNLHTYLKQGGKRLDWILISNELAFVNYEVLSDVISDHQVVMAAVSWNQP